MAALKDKHTSVALTCSSSTDSRISLAVLCKWVEPSYSKLKVWVDWRAGK